MASITVVGTGFTGATMCFFGSQGVTISLNAGATSFTCIPPAGIGGVTIGITGSGGTVSTASGYTYVGSPTITSLGVTSGSTAGGTLVRIYGDNFYDRIGITFPGFYCGVSFGTIGVTADIYGITHCYVITPVSSVAGPVSIKLKTPTGIAIGLTFTYVNYCSRLDPFPYGFVQPICTAGVTSSCLNNTGPTGRIGCNCTACCDAVCAFNPLCCELEWDATCVDNVTAAIADKSGDIYERCKYLVNGSCCVKFNVAGLSYGVCLSPEGTSADCTTLVSSLHAANSGSPPWNQSYTYNFVQGGTCGSCTPFCKNSSCLTGLPGGITCQYGCGPCCSRFGFCDGSCECEFVAECILGYFWDDISCSCREGKNPFTGPGVGTG